MNQGRAVVTLALAGALLALPRGARAAEDPPAAAPRDRDARSFALVIGHNDPPRADLPRLRYADDDAVRWAVLFATVGATVELLTELDADSRRLYGDAVPSNRRATRAAVVAAMARLSAHIQIARAAGSRTALYFVYAGHGDVDQADEGYVTLADGRFSRADLEREVLAMSRADANHVIVDACRSYFFAYDRGPGGSRGPWRHPYFNAGAAASHPNTGFLLSSSSRDASHEWEEFQSGVFSHEVRSALLGAADVDGDGRVTYRELTAFVRRANQPIRNERFRPRFVARAPSVGGDVLIDLGRAQAGSVLVGGGLSGRHVLEDGMGVRWIDFNSGPAQSLRLILPAARWTGSGFYLRPSAGSLEYRVPVGAAVRLADLTPAPVSTIRRGALDDALGQLFVLPFDATAVQAMLDLPAADDAPVIVGATPAPEKPPLRWRRPLGLGLALAGAVSLAVAGGFTTHAFVLKNGGDGASGAERSDLNARIARDNDGALGTAIAGGALAAVGAALLLWARAAPGETP